LIIVDEAHRLGLACRRDMEQRHLPVALIATIWSR
jgi:hypothetical protein